MPLFDAAARRRQIEQFIATDLPPGKRLAVVAVIDPLTGAADFHLVTKRKWGIQVGAVVAHEPNAVGKWGWSSGLLITGAW